jgi:hypothetical protein
MNLQDPISEIPNTKKNWWSGSRWRLEFKPQYCKATTTTTAIKTLNSLP